MSYEDTKEATPPPVPIAIQPRGKQYFLGTWSGRLILINALIFVIMSWQSRDIMIPLPDVLMAWGAKDPVAIAQGQYWRFLTPMFVHIGIIHFAFNTWALYVIAFQLESLLGARWFLFLYFLSGILGNVSSAVFSLAVSAGASGALFGLLGSGFYVERAIGSRIAEQTGRRPRSGVYTGMVVANVILGFVIPQIDNAAHLGGLVTGIVTTFALLRLRRNRLRQVNKPLGIAVLTVLIGTGIAGAAVASNPSYLFERLMTQAEQADSAIDKYHYYSDAIRLEPDNLDLRFLRGRLLVMVGELNAAREDFELVAARPEYRQRLRDLQSDLEKLGRREQAEWLGQFILN